MDLMSRAKVQNARATRLQVEILTTDMMQEIVLDLRIKIQGTEAHNVH